MSESPVSHTESSDDQESSLAISPSKSAEAELVSERLMSVQGHQRLARTLHFTACLPPLGLMGITIWLLPQLPPLSPERLTSLELPFLGFCFLSAALCDTTFFLRLRRFKSLPLPSERARVPPPIESKRGWIACLIAWGLAQVYTLLGVTEVFLSRRESALWPFAIFTAITLYRCRPRHGLFAASNWGTPAPSPLPDGDASRRGPSSERTAPEETAQDSASKGSKGSRGSRGSKTSRGPKRSKGSKKSRR